jgi:peptide/nickel transport system substrate-binding protein
LAESWTVSDDKLTWTMKILDGLTFHSGAPCTNANVVEDFKLFADPKIGQNAVFWTPVKNIAAGDGNTVVLTMAHPFAAFPETLATEYSMIYNQAARAKAGETYGATTEDGTGPFTLEEFTPGTTVRMKRWDKYPGAITPFIQNKGVAYLDELKWTPIVEAANRANEIEAGDVDAIKNPAGQDVDRLKGNSDLVVLEWANPANSFLALNWQRTDLGFNDINVRQALSHAIDREGIVKAVFFGQAVATQGPIASNWKWYDKGVEQFNTYDVDKANQMLDAAGWTKNGDVREKNGVKLSWTHLNWSGQTFGQQISEAVAGMFAKVGAEMKVESYQNPEFSTKLNSKDSPPDSFGYEWLWSSPMDVILLFNTLVPSEAYSGNIPALGQAFADWQNAGDDDQLKAAASKAQLLWAEQLPKIPLVTSNAIWVYNKKVHGWMPTQTMLYPQYNDVWVE